MGMSTILAGASGGTVGRALPEALALRYRVYCEEFGYLPCADYPSGLESDQDDVSALHFHLFEPKFAGVAGTINGEHNLTGHASLAGYVRLVRPDSNGLLPVQRRCHLSLDAHLMPRPELTAEVSRLIIAPEFRRQRGGESGRGKAVLVDRVRDGSQSSSTDLLLRLFRQMVIGSQVHGIRYWFAAMERPLARSLAQMGFPFKEAGPEGEYYGRITPFMADLHELQRHVASRQPRLAQWLLAPPRTGPGRLNTPRAEISGMAAV